MKQATPKKTTRGRDKADPVDRLRTRVWYRSIEVASGKDKNYALARLMEELQVNEAAPQARTWLRYKKGDRVPQRGEAAVFVVDLAESHFASTKAYFESALWEVLKGRRYSPKELDASLLALGAPVKAILFDERPVSDGGPGARTLDFVTASRLVALRSFEAFVATILLVAKCEAIGQAEPRHVARDAYIELQEEMDADPVIGPFIAEICRFADKVCTHWSFPSNQMQVITERVTRGESVRAAMERLRAVRIPWPDRPADGS